MADLAEIQALADSIAREFRPRRIVLFGSHAYGRPGPDSDVDLLIVAEYEGHFWEYAGNIRRRVQPSFRVDLLIRTPAEIQERLKMGDFFMEEVVRRGRVLYEALHR
ncbi:MAG: nucleotidyltransferase domain-containing protein [Planctomycetes bacterium]|nr:nucleotidyltransferase domain-containing protein [Planctomycetota bacterium]